MTKRKKEVQKKLREIPSRPRGDRREYHYRNEWRSEDEMFELLVSDFDDTEDEETSTEYPTSSYSSADSTSSHYLSGSSDSSSFGGFDD